jgi:hypothetical protein
MSSPTARSRSSRRERNRWHLLECLASVTALLVRVGAANADTGPKGCVYNIKNEAVVTHYPTINATDDFAPDPWGPVFTFANNFLPSTNSYLADSYSHVAIDDQTKNYAIENRMCADSGGVPFSLYSWTPGVVERVLGETKAGSEIPNNPNPWTGPGTGRVRVLHGLQLGGFVTVFLPPTWEPGASTTYPIVAEAYYDVNENVFKGTGHAQLIAKTVAQSGLYDRRGAIGVVWNGGAAIASATANPAAIQQFADVINWVSTFLRGERHNIYMIGRSRGGTAPLILASSGRTDFTIKHIVAMAFAPKFGSHISSIGATMPAQMVGLAGGTGYSKSWRPGFVYNGPAGSGITAKEAFSRNVIGDTLASLDTPSSLTAASLTTLGKLNNIAAMNPRVQLLIGSHDEWVQFGNELEYLMQLRARIAVEGHVVLRGGHLKNAESLSGFSIPGVSDNIGTRFMNAVLGAVDSAAYLPALSPNTVKYYNIAATGANPGATGIVPVTALNESTELPVTVEVPYKTWAGMPYDIFVTGPNGTIVEFQTNLGNFQFTVGTTCNTTAVTPGKVSESCSFSTSGWPAQIVYFNVLVKTPSMPTLVAVPWTLAGCNPAGTPLISTLGSYLPDVIATEVWSGAYSVKQAAVCANWSETNYGMVRSYQ